VVSEKEASFLGRTRPDLRETKESEM
jgi:hypothetical protein